MSYIGNPIVSTDFPKDTFSGNGSTTAFTMQIAPASVNSVIVVVSGITQDPSTYTISGTTLTFSSAPPTGTSNISVRHLGVAGIPNTPSAGSVVTTSIADSNVTTAKIADANITQAKLAAGVVGTGPSFAVSGNNANSQSVSGNTTAKITFYTTAGSDYSWDTATCWNSANNRFIPNVAGYYTFATNLGTAGWSSGNQFNLIIRKNGSVNRWVFGTSLSSSNDVYMNGSCMLYMNGSTDYVEVYLFNNGGNTITVRNESERTWFTGSMIRAA